MKSMEVEREPTEPSEVIADAVRLLVFDAGCQSDEPENHDLTEETVRAFFERIAAEEGWQPGVDLSASAPWHPHSRYFAARVGAELVGALQLVRCNPAGLLPTRAVWPELFAECRTDIADVFVLAIAPAYRARRFGGVPFALFWLLCIALWRDCRRAGITELCGIATPRTLRRYQRLGWPLIVAGPERLHWGEICIPFRVSVAAFEVEIAGRAALGSTSYRAILESALGKMKSPRNQRGQDSVSEPWQRA